MTHVFHLIYLLIATKNTQVQEYKWEVRDKKTPDFKRTTVFIALSQVNKGKRGLIFGRSIFIIVSVLFYSNQFKKPH